MAPVREQVKLMKLVVQSAYDFMGKVMIEVIKKEKDYI